MGAAQYKPCTEANDFSKYPFRRKLGAHLKLKLGACLKQKHIIKLCAHPSQPYCR